MRVFVTGASGHIGSAVVPELLQAGHQVIGLAHSHGPARRSPRRAPRCMRTGNFASAADTDLRVIQALGATLAGTGKPLATSSGTLLLTLTGVTGRPGTEQDAAADGPRVEAENTVVGLADRGVRSSVVRLPRSCTARLTITVSPMS
jgi:uncharacterized protein YbjT (DUF2867 family)